MKGLETLIKLKKRALDELRREVAALERQKQQLADLSAQLSRDLAKELELTSRQPGMSMFFSGFAKRVKARQEQIGAEMQALEKKIIERTREVTEAFAELKKFEIARDRAKKRAEKEAQRKETVRLDEIAGQQNDRKRRHPVEQ